MWEWIQFLTNSLQVINGECIYGIWPWSWHGSNQLMGSIYSVLQFFLPLIIIIFCYGTILWKLSNRTNLSNKNQQVDTYQRARRNVTTTFCIVAFFFVVCWVQQQTLYLMFLLGYPVDFRGFYWNFAVEMVFLNCTVNPFIYLVKSKDFQDALKEFLGLKKLPAVTSENTSIFSLSQVSLQT